MNDAIQFEMGFHCTSALRYTHHVIVYFQTSNLKWSKIGLNIYFFWFRFIYSFKESKGLFLRRRIHTVMTQLLATATHQLLALSSF